MMTTLIAPVQPDLNHTCGDWHTECAAEQALVDFLEMTVWFEVYRQLPGELLWKRHFQQHQSVRADLLLVPTARLIEAGWYGGVLLIEVKRSGKRIGPGLNQLNDYLNAVWPICGGIGVVANYAFLFPAPAQVERTVSWMANQHIGTAQLQHDSLDLYCGHSRVLRISESGEIGLGRLNFGRKAGGR